MALSLDQVREVYNRPESEQDVNHGIYAWGEDGERTDQRTYNFFLDIMGREPTEQEFSEALPYFHGQGDQGELTGRNYLNQLRRYEEQDPDKGQGRYAPEKLEEYGGDINKQYQEQLGRDATPEELEHFQNRFASRELDPYSLQGYVQQLPEYQQAQDKEFRGELAGELEGYDQTAFGRQKQDLLSHYAQQGMPAGTSPSLDFAMTDMMAKIAEKRQSFLTGLSAQQYQGNKAGARSDYERSLDELYGNRNYGQQRQDQMSDQLRGRQYESQDYTRQMQDYLRSAGQAGGSSNKFAQSGAGALQGAGSLAPLGPGGAIAGGIAGGLFPWLT